LKLGLVCDACWYAVPGERPNSLVCRILNAEVEPTGPCRVTKEGLTLAAREEEPLRDRIYELEETFGFSSRVLSTDRYGSYWDDLDLSLDEYQRLKPKLVDYPKAMLYLWRHIGHSRRCTQCDRPSLDSEARYCDLDGKPLVFKRRTPLT
jgi:hypothetical protein